MTTSPDISLTVIRSETVGPEVEEASFLCVFLKYRLKKRLMTREIIDKTRVLDNHLEMNGFLNASPSSAGVWAPGGADCPHRIPARRQYRLPCPNVKWENRKGGQSQEQEGSGIAA